jgi:hypothetical protein
MLPHGSATCNLMGTTGGFRAQSAQNPAGRRWPSGPTTPTVSYTSPTGYYMAHTYGALPASFAAYASATEITASACPAVFLRFSS